MNTTDDLASRWVRSAARAAPTALRERLEEEWLADLTARSGWLARVSFGAGCQWAARAIAHDFAGAQLTAATAGAEHAFALPRPHGASGPQRTLTLFVIVGLHAVALYALTRNHGQPILPVKPPVTKVHFIDSNPTAEPRPRGPMVDVGGTAVEPLSTPAGFRFSDDSGLALPGYREPGGIGSGAAPVHRVKGGLGAGFPAAEDFYPASAKRLGEHGVAAVNVCVDPAGRLIADPTIADPSSSPRLDEGALRLARAGSGHYRPATENGQAVNSCYTFRVRFELRD